MKCVTMFEKKFYDSVGILIRYVRMFFKSACTIEVNFNFETNIFISNLVSEIIESMNQVERS